MCSGIGSVLTGIPAVALDHRLPVEPRCPEPHLDLVCVGLRMSPAQPDPREVPNAVAEIADAARALRDAHPAPELELLPLGVCRRVGGEALVVRLVGTRHLSITLLDSRISTVCAKPPARYGAAREACSRGAQTAFQPPTRQETACRT